MSINATVFAKVIQFLNFYVYFPHEIAQFYCIWARFLCISIYQPRWKLFFFLGGSLNDSFEGRISLDRNAFLHYQKVLHHMIKNCYWMVLKAQFDFRFLWITILARKPKACLDEWAVTTNMDFGPLVSYLDLLGLVNQAFSLLHQAWPVFVPRFSMWAFSAKG